MEVQKEVTQSPNARVYSKRGKQLTTLAIVLGNICTGTATGAYSLALVDLKNKYDTSIEDISILFTILTIGYCVGGIATGFLYKFMNRQLGIILFHTGTAAAMYLTPHCPSTVLLFCVGGLQGFCGGAYDASQVVWIMEMWQADSGPYIQAQGLGWALSGVTTPLFLVPFLTGEPDGPRSEPLGNPDMYIPFTMIGALATIVTVFQILLFSFSRYFPPPPDRTRSDQKLPIESEGPNKEAKEGELGPEKPGRDYRRIKIITLSAVFLGCDQGLCMCTMSFLPTFVQYGALRLSQREAAYISSGMTGGLLGGRLLGILVALKVPPQFMFCANLGILTATNVALLFFADTSVVILWACAIALGLGMSTTYPSYNTFIERHLRYTNGVGSIIFTFGSTVAAIYPLVVGKYMETNPGVLMYTNFFSLFWMVLATVVLFRMTICRSNNGESREKIESTFM